jgi:methylated-DNA-protein-cysteine methyltransferase related protein
MKRPSQARFVGKKLAKKKPARKKPAGKKHARSTSGKSAPADRRGEIVRLIRSLPSGKVSSYGAIAKAAGWAGAARQVVQVLRQVPGLPWHRVLGAGGAIKLPGENGAEQRFRLRMEGVTFRGMRVDMERHEFKFGQRGK